MSENKIQQGTVTFIGAGPGDPELITVKGHKCICSADLILYAGSLVPLATISCAKASAEVIDSSGLTLDECHKIMRDSCFNGLNVARVHTGDPSLYGTIQEQILLLQTDNIAYGIIPGVTSACAAAAAANVSFTIPNATQSLIITRMTGRTPVPASENIRELAKHHCSMAIYLSAQHVQKLQEELLYALPANTPVLCFQRVGWPDAKQVWTDIANLAQTTQEHNMDRQTVFLILPCQNDTHSKSKLYDPTFSHGWRQKKSNT